MGSNIKEKKSLDKKGPGPIGPTGPACPKNPIRALNLNTVFPHIVSAETILFGNAKVTVHKAIGHST